MNRRIAILKRTARPPGKHQVIAVLSYDLVDAVVSDLAR